jgi:hypothetical protein
MKRVLSVGIVAVLLSGVSFAAYKVYDNIHISSDLKRVLIAANDKLNSDADIKAYVHQAKPLIKTKRDQEVEGKFQEAVSLAESSTEISNRLMEETLSSISEKTDECDKSFYDLIDLENRYRADGIRVPQDLVDEIHQANKEVKPCIERRDQQREADEKAAKEQLKQARKLLGEVRSELGLPPLPKPVE